MSEFESKKESEEYVEMSPITHYYNDVYFVRESQISAIMALDNLVQGFPVDHQEVFVKMMKSDFMPDEWEMENNIVTAKEKLAMLPLVVLAPVLEDSNCDLDDLKLWYYEAMRGVRLIAQGIHTDECLKCEQSVHGMCDYSMVCPRQFSQRFLIEPAITPDFGKDIYKTAPKREYAIVKNKVSLAIQQNLIESDAGQEIRKGYQVMYNAYMNKRAIGRPDRIV